MSQQPSGRNKESGVYVDNEKKNENNLLDRIYRRFYGMSLL